MPISLRLDKGLEDSINKATRVLHTTRTDLIKRAVQKFLTELSKEAPSVYAVYQSMEDRVPGSGHGTLSIDHRKEVLKRIRAKK